MFRVIIDAAAPVEAAAQNGTAAMSLMRSGSEEEVAACLPRHSPAIDAGPSDASSPGVGAPSPTVAPTAAVPLPSGVDAGTTLSEEVRFTVGAVDVYEGTLRLFRERGVPIAAAAGSSRTLCIIAVPSALSAADLCSFVAPYTAHIQHLRIVRDTVKGAARYMALLRFATADAADGFYRGFNGKHFNSMDPEVCHVVYVSTVVLHRRPHDRAAVAAQAAAADDVDALSIPDTLYGDAEYAALSLEGLTELPTCPVCLERLDASASGLLTTLCNHTFHCSCLSRWRDDTCPVCRHCNADEEAHADATTACESCGVHENLWMCLLCGHVGCGRATREHAVAHWRSTGHTYSIELATQRVWDYSGDGYVHRLIHNRTDGKLVELPDPHTTGDMERSRIPPAAASYDCDKSEALAVQYTLVLTGQLDAQREYFQERMAQLLSLIPPDDSVRRHVAETIVYSHEALRLDGSDIVDMVTRTSPSWHAMAPPIGATAAGTVTMSASASASMAVSASAAVGDVVSARAVVAVQDQLDELRRTLAHTRRKLEDAERRATAAEHERRDMHSRLNAISDHARLQAEELAFLRDVNEALTRHQREWEKKLADATAVHEREQAAAAARVRESEEQVRDLMFSLDTQAKLAGRTDLDAGHVVITTEGGSASGSSGRGSASSSTAARLRAQLAARQRSGATSAAMPALDASVAAAVTPDDATPSVVAGGAASGGRKSGGKRR